MSAGSETALRGQTQPAARAPGRLLGKVRVGRPADRWRCALLSTRGSQPRSPDSGSVTLREGTERPRPQQESAVAGGHSVGARGGRLPF